MTFYAEKRWGHGRLRQLFNRTICRIFGHSFDRPVDGVRRCRYDCGGMTMHRG